MTLRSRKRRFLGAFGVHIFGNFGNKANISIQYYLVPHWLSADPKTDDLYRF